MIQVARCHCEAISAEVAVAGAVTFLRTLSTFLSTLGRPHEEGAVVLRVSSESRRDQSARTSAEVDDSSKLAPWGGFAPRVATTARRPQRYPGQREGSNAPLTGAPGSSATDQQRRHVEDVQAASTDTGRHQLVLRARLCCHHDLRSSSVRPRRACLPCRAVVERTGHMVTRGWHGDAREK